MTLDLTTAEARHLARCELDVVRLGLLAHVIPGAPFIDPVTAAHVYGSLSLAVEAGEAAARHGRWPTPEFVRDFVRFRENAWIDLTAAREALAKARLSPSSPWVEVALGEATKLVDEVERLSGDVHNCGECGAQMVPASFMEAVDAKVEERVPKLQERVQTLHMERDEARSLAKRLRQLVNEPVCRLAAAVETDEAMRRWNAEKASGG